MVKRYLKSKLKQRCCLYLIIFLVSVVFLINKDEFLDAIERQNTESARYEQIMGVVLSYLDGEQEEWEHQTGDIGDKEENRQENLTKKDEGKDISYYIDTYFSKEDGGIESAYFLITGYSDSGYSIDAKRYASCTVYEDKSRMEVFSNKGEDWNGEREVIDAEPVYLIKINCVFNQMDTEINMIYNKGCLYWVGNQGEEIKEDGTIPVGYSYTIFGQGKNGFMDRNASGVEYHLIQPTMNNHFILMLVLTILGVGLKHWNKKRANRQIITGAMRIEKKEIWLSEWIADEFYLAAGYLGAFAALMPVFRSSIFMSRIPSYLAGRLLLSVLIVTVIEWGLTRFRKVWATVLIPVLGICILFVSGWTISEYAYHFFNYTSYTLESWIQVLVLILYQMKDFSTGILARFGITYDIHMDVPYMSDKCFMELSSTEYWILYTIGCLLILIIILFFVKDGEKCSSEYECSDHKTDVKAMRSERTKKVAGYTVCVFAVMFISNLIMEMATYYRMIEIFGDEDGAAGILYLQLETPGGFPAAISKLLPIEDLAVMPVWLSSILGILILVMGMAIGHFGVKFFGNRGIEKQRRKEI